MPAGGGKGVFSKFPHFWAIFYFFRRGGIRLPGADFLSAPSSPAPRSPARPAPALLVKASPWLFYQSVPLRIPHFLAVCCFFRRGGIRLPGASVLLAPSSPAPPPAGALLAPFPSAGAPARLHAPRRVLRRLCFSRLRLGFFLQSVPLRIPPFYRGVLLSLACAA
jgi:hypothetical protein